MFSFLFASSSKSWDAECQGINCVKNVYIRAVVLTTATGLSTVEIETFDELSVTFCWRSVSGGPVVMRATLLQGSPYLTLEFITTAPVLRTLNDPWMGQMPASLTRDSNQKFKVGAALCMLAPWVTDHCLSLRGAPNRRRWRQWAKRA